MARLEGGFHPDCRLVGLLDERLASTGFAGDTFSHTEPSRSDDLERSKAEAEAARARRTAGGVKRMFEEWKTE